MIENNKEKSFILMEYLQGGSLFEKVITGNLPSNICLHYFRELIEVFEFMHS